MNDESGESMQWRRQDFVTGGSEVWVYRGSRVRSLPVLLSVYQSGSLLDGLAMYLSCDTKKFHDNESTHTYYIIFGRPPIGGNLSFPLPPPGGATESMVPVDEGALINWRKPA